MFVVPLGYWNTHYAAQAAQSRWQLVSRNGVLMIQTLKRDADDDRAIEDVILQACTHNKPALTALYFSGRPADKKVFLPFQMRAL